MKILLIFPFIFISLSFADEKKIHFSSLKKISQEWLKKDPKTHYSHIIYPNFFYNPPKPNNYKRHINQFAHGYFYKDSSIDLLQITIHFKEDNYQRSPKKIAEQLLYFSNLQQGGTKELSPLQIEDTLDFTATKLSISYDNEGTNLFIECLPNYFEPMIKLAYQIITEPRFDSDIFTLNQKKLKQQIEHRFDYPSAILDVASNKVMDPTENILLTKENIDYVRIRDIKKWINKKFNPSEVIIGVAGEFDEKQIINTLNVFLNKLNKRQHSTSISPVKSIIESKKEKTIYYIKEELSQSNIKILFPGIKRPHPDYYPLSLANYILGGSSLGSILMKKIREEKGLAYSVYSSVGSNYYRDGIISLTLQTKKESTKEALKITIEQIKNIHQNGFTQEQLKSAKQTLIASLPSLFDNLFTTIDVFVQNDIWKRKPTHFSSYPRKINRINLKTLNETFKKYFDLDKIRIVIVGDQKVLENIGTPINKIVNWQLQDLN